MLVLRLIIIKSKKLKIIMGNLYNDSRTVAPNNLYNAAMSLPNASNLKGPNSVTAKPYLKYFGK